MGAWREEQNLEAPMEAQPHLRTFFSTSWKTINLACGLMVLGFRRIGMVGRSLLSHETCAFLFFLGTCLEGHVCLGGL